MKTTTVYSHILENDATVQSSSIENPEDSFDLFKSIFKKFPKLYYFLVYTISPVCPTVRFRIKKFLKNGGIIVNFGSGNSRLSEDIINIDLMNYDNVDVVSDITQTPFKSNSVDQIISIAALEHVRDPKAVVSEMERVLKPGGAVFCFIPFIQGFHASPHDYQRFTRPGMRVLFENFEIDRVDVDGGPTSGFLWILQEWIATFFSFGSVKTHFLITVCLMALIWPLKFLDFILIKNPRSENISSGFTVIARKKEVAA